MLSVIKQFLIVIGVVAFILVSAYWIANKDYNENFDKLKPYPVGSFVKLKYNGMRGQVRSHNYSAGFARVLCGESHPEIHAIFPSEMEPIETEVEAKP